MPEFVRISLPIEKLIFDPNNFRFRDLETYSRVDPNRFHEGRIQERAYSLLKNTPTFGVRELKDSIRTNGFVPIDQIFVRPFDTDEGTYLVIEGNRRVAAIRWLLEEHAGGVVTLTNSAKEKLETLEVVALESDEDENPEALFQVIMAIRHVSGIKQWGTYQQARLVAELRDSGLDPQTVGERLAMHPREVARRYRAAKALEKMEQDEDYGEYVKPEMYGVFHEVISIPELRDTWLGWNADTFEFTNTEAREQFYKLISPKTDDTGEITGEAKITKGDEARKLKQIITHPDAAAKLMEEDSTFAEAFAIAYADERDASNLVELNNLLERTHQAIDRLSPGDLTNLTDDQLADLHALEQTIRTSLRNRDKLLVE